MDLERKIKKIDVFVDILKSIQSLSVSQTNKVACMAVRKDFSKIAAFGYNGRHSGASINPSTNGEELSLEPGESGMIHGEINMVAKFKQNDPENYIVLVTLSPCLMCAQVLINSDFEYIYWIDEYRETDHLKIFHEEGIMSGDINQLKKDYGRIIRN